MFKEQGLDIVELPTVMDTHFISFLEMKNPEIKFKRIDSVISDEQDTEKDEDKDKALAEKFKTKINDDTLKIEVKALKNEEVPAVLLLSEESRRMQEMYRSYGQQMAGMANMFHDEFTLVVNKNNELIKKLDSLSAEDADWVMDQV